MAKKTTKQVLTGWHLFYEELMQETANELSNESLSEKRERIAMLEADVEKWFKYYFSKYAYAEPAKFHKRATQRLLNNNQWYECRAWSREMAKDARTMFEFIYLSLTGKVKNILFISHSWEQAANLLEPYRITLERNPRIISDYGTQASITDWAKGTFTTTKGVSFTAVGAGQNPRGARKEEIRPDGIIFSDIDTDEEVLKQSRIDKKWKWIEGAVLGTISVSKSYRIVFLNNILAKDTCMTRAMEKAMHAETINIRDKNGKSNWPDKNSEEAIDKILALTSYVNTQREYFNNPITEGDVFKTITWAPLPKGKDMKVIMKYGDPSYSNNTKATNSRKCIVAVTEIEGSYYILSCKLAQATAADFVKWFWQIDHDYTKNKAQIKEYIENNSLQNPYYEQVLIPLFTDYSKEVEELKIPKADDRQKIGKFERVEGNLEPLNRVGKLIFNEAQKNNPYMILLAEQFKAFNKDTAQKLDGPDTVEGAVFLLQKLTKGSAEIKTYKHSPNLKYRY